jgi:hypothetical protein
MYIYLRERRPSPEVMERIQRWIRRVDGFFRINQLGFLEWERVWG